MARSKFNKNKKRQSGGRVSLPIEYFGGSSGRYFAEGSPQLVPENSAYGKTHATSHGTLIDNNMMGPDLGPYPYTSGKQTGGRRRQRGGRVSMPIEYYGGSSGAYSATPATCQHSYGSAPNTIGNNLGPCPNQTGTLTGGGCGVSVSKNKPRSRRQSGGKKSKRTSSKKSKGTSSKKSKRTSSKKSKGTSSKKSKRTSSKKHKSRKH